MKNRTCSVDGCDRRHSAKSYCATHYYRFSTFGDPGPVEIKPRGKGDEICSVTGCDNPHATQGWCNTHRQRVLRHGDTDQRPRLSGPAHPNWAGDDVTYMATHKRVARTRGQARGFPCVACSGPAAEWAYDHADLNEKTSTVGVYSVDPRHYQPMCVPCHRRLDKAWRSAS